MVNRLNHNLRLTNFPSAPSPGITPLVNERLQKGQSWLWPFQAAIH